MVVADSNPSYEVRDESKSGGSVELDSTKILHAWRDFECSFFAGALLCPRVPFRQLLDRNGYEIDVCKQAGVSESIAMRRMTAVSPYPHWHYFDAYNPVNSKRYIAGMAFPCHGEICGWWKILVSTGRYFEWCRMMTS